MIKSTVKKNHAGPARARARARQATAAMRAWTRASSACVDAVDVFARACSTSGPRARDVASNALALGGVGPLGRSRARSGSDAPRRAFSRAGGDASSVVGLYGLDGLHEPKDFARLAREVVSRCDDKARALSARAASAESVRALDEISDEICRVVDVAEVCRHTHPSREYVEAAERAYVTLQEYVARLNADVDLYEALRRAREVDGRNLNEEGARVALTLQEDFERGGIHLDRATRQDFDASLSKALQLGMEFQRNVLRPEHFNKVSLDASAFNALPRLVQGGFQRTADGKAWTTAVDSSNSSVMLRHLKDSNRRRDVFTAANSGPEPNKRVLADLIDARADMARCLGFETYANFAIAPLMARKPEAVREFLLNLSDSFRERAREEYDLIRRYSRDKTVQVWDKAYWMAQVRGHECELSSSAISEYFPLDGVIVGIGEILERVLGVRIEMQDLGPGEGWTNDLKKLIVKTVDGEMRGTVYLDLLPRTGKFNHAAHFVIRCSRTVSPSERQNPSVALVCNFPKTHGTGNILLSHGEVETLLHEFGHAMHSVLSDTEYQHLSGTRAPMDIVEIPSHLFEHFAWDPSALKILGRHYITQEPIPDSMIAALRKSKEIFRSIETQQQLVFALTDLELHNQSSSLSPSAVGELAAAIQQEHSMFPPAPGTNWELRFSHFIGYGATYYSYLYADVLARDIWKQYFAGDSLASGAGEALRDKLLRHGGSRAPEKMVREVLGEESLLEFKGGYRPCNERR